MLKLFSLIVCTAAVLLAQNTRSVVGTVTGFKVESAEIQVKPDTGDALTARITPATLAQKVAPGAADLKSAETIRITDVAAGDRVLATLDTATGELRRIVVMAAGDIAKRNAADRADWAKRGISGIVVSKKNDEIAVRIKTLQGEMLASVSVSGKTTFKRYAPDSVKFADAKPGKIAEVSAGDELRARGQKSPDGLKVAAEEVVFGTFETRAGAVTSIDREAREITVRDLTNDKPLVIKLAPESQLKSMAALAAGLGGRGAAPAGRSGAAPNSAAGAGRGAPAAGAGAPPAAAAQAQASAAKAMAQMSVAQLLEAMPPAKFEEIKEGETIVVSSTKGAVKDHITAITLVSKAELLIQIAEAQAKSTAMALAAAGMAGTGSGGVQIPGMQ